MTQATTTEAGAVKVSVAADLLGVSKRTVYYLIDSGELPAIRHPGRTGRDDGPISIERADIAAYKAAHRTTP